MVFTPTIFLFAFLPVVLFLYLRFPTINCRPYFCSGWFTNQHVVTWLAISRYALQKDKNLFHSNCSGSALNTLIFRDSFFTGLQAYISQYFQHNIFVWQKIILQNVNRN